MLQHRDNFPGSAVYPSHLFGLQIAKQLIQSDHQHWWVEILLLGCHRHDVQRDQFSEVRWLYLPGFQPGLLNQPNQCRFPSLVRTRLLQPLDVHASAVFQHQAVFSCPLNHDDLQLNLLGGGVTFGPVFQSFF